jgi:citrate lyase subunit beta/citryl-CoA lyase
MTGDSAAGSARKGEAGRRGADVRSDLFVSLEVRRSGGIDLALNSRVDLYYGESIRSDVRSILERLHVPHARVEIDDAGALPFTIAARVEAAARRAGTPRTREARPERTAPIAAPSAKDRLRRSRLYLPGNEPKFMLNAGLHAPDAVILDLEDSVHPAEKDAARLLVRNALRCIDFGGSERMVRINQLPLGDEDLKAIVPEIPDLILIPKVEEPHQVREVDARVTALLGKAGETRPVWLMPILESALGIEKAFEIAQASGRIAALTLGLEDYTADLGVVKTVEGTESLYARMRVVVAAKAAGLQAIDSVFGDVGDMKGLTRWAVGSRQLGFEGMGCIHPRQIEVIHRVFAPTAAEIEKALRIVAAYEEARAKGLAVISLGAKMIDPPVVQRALKLVKQARDMGLVPAPEVQS